MSRVSRFARGSAVYKCECCGKLTRKTGPDHAENFLCEPCWELGGIENEHSDCCGFDLDILECPRHAEEVKALVAKGAKLGA